MEKTKELVDIKNEKEFNKVLDEVTGFGGGYEVLPVIKYNATEGIFVRSDNDKDDDDRTIYPTELGQSIDLHIINASFQLASSGEKAKIYTYTKEYTGQNITLLNGEGEVVTNGKYKDLKESFDLRYTKILYAYYGEDLVRVRLSGYALTAFFPYLNTHGNPARHITTLKRDKDRLKGLEGACKPATKEEIKKYEALLKAGKSTKSINLFYGMKVAKSKIVPREIIVDRVKKVNQHLINKNASSPLTAVPEDTKKIENANDIDVADAPLKSGEGTQTTLEEADKHLSE